MSHIPVTVILPVKNEEDNLRRCLPLLDLFDQIIVVDSQSTDETAEISKKYGADVHQFHWNGQFPKKRNWALRNLSIKNEWVLFLDADEYVTDFFLNEVQEKIKAPSVDGYWLTYQTYFMGKKLNHGDKLKKLALFRHKKGEYERIEEDYWSHLDMEVHEQAQVKGEESTIESKIQHEDYKGLEKYIDRHNAYSSWEANHFVNFTEENWNHLSSRKRLKYRLMKLGLLPIAFFIGSYILKRGFLDGKEGFYFALYKSYYFFQIQTKVRELIRNGKSYES